MQPYRTGNKLYANGATVTLVGPANAGKSSLFNLMLLKERSIVSSIAGTTRDYVEGNTHIKGIPIRLVDTAGLNEKASDIVELEGIKRTKSLIDDSDILILVHENYDVIKKDSFYGKLLDDNRVIIVQNKSDQNSKVINGLPLSVHTRHGYDVLLNTIEKKLTTSIGKIDREQLAIEDERQYKNLVKCKESLDLVIDEINNDSPLDLIASDLYDTFEIIQNVLGEYKDMDILSKMFSKFCVGK